MISYDESISLLPAHLQDVKAVLAIDMNLLASASRDSSIALWTRSTASAQFGLKALFRGHDSYVNSLAYIPPSDEKKEELLASGGNSSVILIHSLHSLDPQPLTCLVGHALNVCSLHYYQIQAKLISGSWDCTARVWSRDESGEWTCSVRLEGHTQAVWDACVIQEGPHAHEYMTASADCSIRLWDQDGQLLRHFKGSQEPVRSLAFIPGGKEFASASNDGLIRIWAWSGSIVASLRGHTDYVYQVVWSETGHLISCGEDHTARVWNTQGVQEAILLHPCQTVWSISSLKDGTIISGGSDGTVRTWMRGLQKRADDIDEEKASTPSDLEETSDKSLSDDNSLIGPQLIIVDVDIQDDVPPLKLTFTRDADPHRVAEDFGCHHSLSETYIKQIEEFIKSHVAS